MKNASNHTNRSGRRSIAWLVGGIMVLAFVAGIMVDVDHPLAQVLGIHDARFLHPYFAYAGLILLGSGIVLALACLCRYLQLRLLKR